MGKIVGRNNAKEARERMAYWQETREKRISYEKEKAEYAASKEGIFDERLRNIVKDATEAEREVFNSLVVAMVKLREEIVELIKATLAEENEDFSCLPFETIEQVHKNMYRALTKLKIMNESDLYKMFHHAGRPNELEKLYIELMDNVDIRFAMFAPARSLNRKVAKYHRLQEEMKDAMFARLEKFGLTDNEEFLLAHEKTFRNQIEEKGYSL